MVNYNRYRAHILGKSDMSTTELRLKIINGEYSECLMLGVGTISEKQYI